MVQASQPETNTSTGTMILGVQCACRVIQWKDGDHSIEPCQLHAVADDLLKALEELADEQALFAPQLPPIYAERLTRARAVIAEALSSQRRCHDPA